MIMPIKTWLRRERFLDHQVYIIVSPLEIIRSKNSRIQLASILIMSLKVFIVQGITLKEFPVWLHRNRRTLLN